MPVLDNEERALLLDLFEFQDWQLDVDSPRFRLRNERHIEQIEALIAFGYIREHAGRYSLSLVALDEIQSSEVDDLLCACDALWSRLQMHYRENLHAQVPLTQLASGSNLSVDVARKAMIYMIQFPWYAGYSPTFPFPEDATIGPDERVIRYETFRDAVAELRRWTLDSQNLYMDYGLESTKDNNSTMLPDETGSKWYGSLEAPLPTILQEIYGARASGYRTLAAMGVRAIVDLVCTKIVGDKGGFKQKIDEIRRLEHLSAKECAAVETVFDAGSASAHRGYLIDEENLDNLIEIMDHLLRSVFRLEQAAIDIKASTPQRLRREK